MTLKELRKEKKLTQTECSEFLGIPLRTYKVYENDPAKIGSIKYTYMMDTLTGYGYIDEEHGVLAFDEIKNICESVLSKYDVKFCYLFGSYAKNIANEKSDVDLLISAGISGLKFYGLVEELRESLHKKVDLLSVDQLKDNFELLNEILASGVKIYG